MQTIRSIVPRKSDRYRIPSLLKLMLSRLGTLVLLFQRMPVVQFLFPEANIIGGASLANSLPLAVTTVVGLGAFDTVAGQSQISETAPLVVLGKDPATSTATAATAINVPATVSAPLTFNFNWDPANDFSTVKSWRCTTGGVDGTLPAGLSPALNVASSVGIGGNITISGTVATPGIYPVTVRVYKNTNYGSSVAAQIFNICVLGFSTQPAATTTINSGGTTTLNCVVAGNPLAIPIVGSGPPAAQPGGTLTYQWYQGAVGVTTTVAPGASTSASYTTPALGSSTNYWVRIKSVLGTSIVTANSTAAAVTVNASDTTPPTVTINQAVAQADPTNASLVNFTVVFSEAVTDFATGDVTIGGTTSGTKAAAITGSGTSYNVAVSGMTGAGTVIASLAAGVAHDAVGNASIASTSTDGTVTFNTPYSSWASGLSPAQRGPDQTPQNDGVTNLAKFAFNLDPLKPDVRVLTVGAGGLAGLPGGAMVGGKLRLEFLRRKASTNPGITYTPQFSSSLGSWADAAVILAPTSLDGTWERVVVDDPAPAPGKRFGRLTVVEAP